MEDLTREQRLTQYLERIMNKNPSEDLNQLAETQSAVQQRQGELGMLEAAAEIGQAGIGASNVGVNLKGSRDAAQARLNDYLAQKKAERNAQYDQMSAAKELVDMEAAEKRAKSGKEYINIEPGKDGRLHKIVKTVGPEGDITQTTDLGIATEFEIEQSNKAREYSLRSQEAQRRETAQETKEAQKASDALLKYNIPGQETALEVVKGNMTVDPETGKATIPGFSSDKLDQAGLLIRRKTDNLTPKERETRSAFQRLANQELKSQSGAAVTDPEYRRFLTAIQAGSWFDFTPEQVANYTGLLEQEIAKKKSLIANVSQRGYKKVTGASQPSAITTPTSTMSAKDQQALDWANANPNDPRAIKIKARLGR